MRAIGFGITLSLVGVVTSAFGFEPYQLNAEDIALVKTSFAAVLKDPDSAKFGTFAAAKKDDKAIIVCGTINAKNSFGGYSGAALFVGEIDTARQTFDVEKLAQTEAETAQVLVRCQNAGAMPAL